MSFHNDVIMKLGGMLPDRFEQLCCRLLPRLSNEYQGLEPSTNRDGKTTKGAADAFKRLSDGSYILFAFTTRQRSVPVKIRSDLKKMAAPDIPVKKVVVCFNTQITLENDLDYQGIAQKHGWELEVYSLHRLADALEDHTDLLFEFLGLEPAKTGTKAVAERGGFLIGERLQQLRQELGLQRSEVIKLIGYPSEKTYLEMETNARECDATVMEQLYKAFGILPDWLTDGKLPKYETDSLLWWQTPEECLARLFDLQPQRVYLSLQARKPNDWLGGFRDLKDGLASLWGKVDSEILMHTGSFHLGLFAEVGPYRYRTYDLAAGLNTWEWRHPRATRMLFQFLHAIVYGSSFEVRGVIIPEWKLNGALYAGYVHPIEVLRQIPPRRRGIRWPYEVLDLAHERYNTRRGRRRYGRWFPRVQEEFRRALAEKES